MQPWNTNAIPHDDVLRGTMDQADFAADLSAAASGSGPEEYRDPRKFFERTYITDGMRRLMVSVIRRLASLGGDPVVQLQTGFGGGKTHTLLAVYHLAKGDVPARELDGVSSVLDEAGGAPPSARVAVIDGLKLSPAQPRTEGKITIATLWGELAWQLLGAEGYKMVAPSDQSAVAPGKGILIPLLKQASPCVLLFDELTAFIRDLREKELPAGTFENNLSVLQALTESVKQVEGAVLLATLPESAAEVGDVGGQRALEALNKLFGRLDSVWKPVGTEESFEIVRRRLFKSTGDEAVRDEVCREFAKLYADHPNDFPQKARESDYFARLQMSYPIHPEVFDRLYDDWSTLEGFQKTRGVLRYLALVIRQLKANENNEPLIMPGSLPLDKADVRNESTRYLSQSTNWGAVIENEIDTDRSKAKQIDLTNERIGQVYGARRVARTIFFGTAPYASNLSRGVSHGMTREEIHLGCVVPGQGIGHYDDALRALTDRLHYLFSDKDRFWFDTHPNLLREMESRAAKVTDTEIMDELRERVARQIDSRSEIFTSHIVRESGDLPDKLTDLLQLAILPMLSDCAYPDNAKKCADDIYLNAGENLRQYRNRVIFAPPETNKINQARESAKQFLAWSRILEEGKDGQLNLDNIQIRQAEKGKKDTSGELDRRTFDAYTRLLVPEIDSDKTTCYLREVPLRDREKSLAASAAKALRNEDAFLEDWDPVSLAEHLESFYFNNAPVISVSQVWEDLGKHCYMERILREQVLFDSIRQGVEMGLFGCAAEKTDHGFRDLVLGDSPWAVSLQTLLVSKDRAEEYQEEERRRKQEQLEKSFENGSAQTGSSTGAGGQTTGTVPGGAPGIGPAGRFTPPPTGQEEAQDQTTGYLHLSVTLNPNNAAGEMSEIQSEILRILGSDSGTDIEVTVDINVTSDRPFDSQTLRNVKENINTLRDSHIDIRILDE